MGRDNTGEAPPLYRQPIDGRGDPRPMVQCRDLRLRYISVHYAKDTCEICRKPAGAPPAAEPPSEDPTT